MVPSNDDAWKKFRDREDEREQDSKQQKKGEPQASGSNSEKLLQLITQAEPLIEQLNHLYQLYFSGAEKRPPVEKRKHLEALMDSITKLPKINPAANFRANTIRQHFVAYKEKWERSLKDFEAGKIKKPAR